MQKCAFLELRKPRAGEFRVKQAVKIKRSVFVKSNKFGLKFFRASMTTTILQLKNFFKNNFSTSY